MVLAGEVTSFPRTPGLYRIVGAFVDEGFLAHRHRVPANELHVCQVVLGQSDNPAQVPLMARKLPEVMNLEQAVEEE